MPEDRKNAAARPAVVVGIESRGGDDTALPEAAAAAVRRKLPLRIVTVLRHAADRSRSVRGLDAADQEAEHWAYGRLDAAAEAVRAGHPDLEVGTACLWQPDLGSTDVLRDAALLVVGPVGVHGRRAFGLRSMSRDLLRSMHCPVMVAPGGGPRRDGAVVAGAGEDPGDAAVLAVAGREAELRAAPLHVLHSWLPLPSETADDGLGRAGKHVADLMAAAGPLPARTVTVLTRDPAAAALAEHGRSASLVVMGSRPGALAGLLLESVSHSLLADPPGPVLVVPRGVVPLAGTGQGAPSLFAGR